MNDTDTALVRRAAEAAGWWRRGCISLPFDSDTQPAVLLDPNYRHWLHALCGALEDALREKVYMLGVEAWNAVTTVKVQVYEFEDIETFQATGEPLIAKLGALMELHQSMAGDGNLHYGNTMEQR